jgi:hypothetical protein
MKGKDDLRDLHIDVIILKSMLRQNKVIGCRLDLTGSKHSPVAGFLEHNNEQSGSIKGTNFNTTLLLKKAS